jgi:hypothetical protein
MARLSAFSIFSPRATATLHASRDVCERLLFDSANGCTGTLFCTGSHGLLGGAEWIRTPGAAWAHLGGIRHEFGALFRPNKSIRVGEKLFAWGSALRRISLVLFVHQVMLGMW